jgi:cytidine deaminase
LLQEDIVSLAERAKESLYSSISPYSGFKVGAAILAADGRVFTGCNIENYSLTLVACAERVALWKALSEDARELRAIAVACGTGEYCYPCGICRQALYEFAPDIKVILVSDKGIKTIPIKELLPFPFVKE